MTKQDYTKMACLAAKIVGGVTAADLTSVSPKYGLLLFMAASMLKDALNRWADTQPPEPVVTTVTASTEIKQR